MKELWIDKFTEWFPWLVISLLLGLLFSSCIISEVSESPDIGGWPKHLFPEGSTNICSLGHNWASFEFEGREFLMCDRNGAVALVELSGR